jgi:hypothetical protein
MNSEEDRKEMESMPTHEDLCVLSRIFNDRENAVPYGTVFRINEWLKANIASALQRRF